MREILMINIICYTLLREGSKLLHDMHVISLQKSLILTRMVFLVEVEHPTPAEKFQFIFSIAACLGIIQNKISTKFGENHSGTVSTAAHYLTAP